MLDFLPAPLLRLISSVANKWDWLGGKINAAAINGVVDSTRNRPHPWSTFSDYISWQGLTDRTFQGRHLPAKPLHPSAPDIAAVTALFARPAGGQKLSKKSTCLFPAFAQYLTDGFIRTDVSHDKDPPPAALMRRKTTTNHEIDMCPLYGRTPAQTRLLRELNDPTGRKGRLKSQIIGGEEFAPFLFLPDGSDIHPDFKPSATSPGLDPPLGVDRLEMPRDQLVSLFAFGGDRANATPMVAMLNILFLREHNRLAGQLQAQNPSWDDERVFQTARNIIIVMFIKIVVEEYINHITPLPFRLRADPSVAWRAKWNRTNWITAEFSLLYRWHSLIPDQLQWPGGPISTRAFQRDNRPLLQAGLASIFVALSAQPAGEVGALNTNLDLLPFEERALAHGRVVDLATYNDYRVHFGKKAAVRFEDISSDPAIRKILKDLYVTPDRVEFYPGLFAEDRVKNSPLPGLLLTMVAVDAFSQALTNPLLSEHVYGNPETFTPWGLAEIKRTGTLEDIMRRNVPAPPTATPLRMTQANWRPA